MTRRPDPVLRTVVVMVGVLVACSSGTTGDDTASSEAVTTPASVPASVAASEPVPEASTAPPEPTPQPLPDGIVAEVGNARRGGLVFIVWDGTAERIAQPAPMPREVVREIGLRIAEPVARFTARAQPDPRTFWVVYPPSGPRARLHLAVRNRLYPVVTVPAEQAQIDSLGTPREPLLNRMWPAR
jgi:hypothetical protein